MALLEIEHGQTGHARLVCELLLRQAQRLAGSNTKFAINA
jgi:hypothetical protein